MEKLEYTLFESQLGWIGLAWNGRALVRLFMPQSQRDAVAHRIHDLLPEATEASSLPDFAANAVDMVKRYSAGEAVDFSHLPVEFDAVDAARSAIYAVLRTLPYGGTLTYGELAADAGYPGMAREIGQAMGKNPVPIIVPCHRVVAASGKLGGFSAPGGARTKEKLLAIEQAKPLRQNTPQSSFAF